MSGRQTAVLLVAVALPMLLGACLTRPVKLAAVVEPERAAPTDRWELVAVATDPAEWAAPDRQPAELIRQMGTACPEQPGAETAWIADGVPDAATREVLARELAGLHETFVAIAGTAHTGGPATRLGRGDDHLSCRGWFRVDHRALRDLALIEGGGAPLHQPLHDCVLTGGGEQLAELERAGLGLRTGFDDDASFQLLRARGRFNWDTGRLRWIRSMPSGIDLELIHHLDSFRARLTWACGQTPWVLVHDSRDGSFETRPCSEPDCRDQRGP